LFKIDNFTSIALSITVPVFHLGMSFGKVQVWKKSGNLYSKLRRNPGDILSYTYILPDTPLGTTLAIYHNFHP